MAKAKGKKPKISKVKTKNIQGGKMTKGKKTGSKSILKARKKLVILKKLKEKAKTSKHGVKPVYAELETRDVLDMLDNEDLCYIRNTEQIRGQFAVNRSESFKQGKHSEKRPYKTDDEDEFENRHRMTWLKENESRKKVRGLLPIKTKQGIQIQSEEIDDANSEPQPANQDNFETVPAVFTDIGPDKPKANEVISTAMLLARRRQKLAEYKLKIGILSSSFLEDPDNRMRNLDSLLAMLVTSDSGVTFTVPKLAAMSLVMVFQDVLPAYSIKHHNQEGVKLKQETRDLQGQEANLLRRYKTFLQRLEKIVGKNVPRTKPKIALSKTEMALGLTALNCMCMMLISHPYFNLAANLINFIVPYLNNWNIAARYLVSGAIKDIFRIDRRGEISYEIVRRINILIKAKFTHGKTSFVRRDVIDVMLALRIKEVDLEKEKKVEMTPKGKMTYEERRMLSKRQRKKAKDMVLLERELLETSAEENKSRKSHYLTEITKLVFTMYFRAIKSTPNSAMLSAVLEGLAKFAHVISVDYFDDLLKVLNKLQSSGTLQQRQTLLCIATVLGVLDGQGSALALDATEFHKSLYAILIHLRCGLKESDVRLALRGVHLATGKNKMPGLRAAAFAKRLTTVALQLEHHDCLMTLLELKRILRTYIAANSLLDSDGSLGSGVYLPELDDPDHSMAQSSTFWELTTLAEHYHPWVRQTVKSIVVQGGKVEHFAMKISAMSAEEASDMYKACLSIEFLPDLPEIHLVPATKNIKRTRFTEFSPKTEFFQDLLSGENEDITKEISVNVLKQIQFLN